MPTIGPPWETEGVRPLCGGIKQPESNPQAQERPDYPVFLGNSADQFITGFQKWLCGKQDESPTYILASLGNRSHRGWISGCLFGGDFDETP